MSVPLRPDLVELSGYHSPQVDVEVRLNTNEAPLGPPDSWTREMQAAIAGGDLNRYPDRSATELRSGLARLHGVEPEQIFCANGSNEVIQSLLLAYGGPGRRALVFEPTYTMHRHIAMITSTDVVTGRRDEGFEIDLPEARSLIEEFSPEITFLCSPNNPTGISETTEIVKAVVAQTSGLVVLDEAYGEFASRNNIELRKSLADAERLVVLRTFSKKWAMAGCRLGYLVGDAEVVRGCELVALPYHLSSLTQMAGLVALRHEPEMLERSQMIVGERNKLARALEDLPVDTWPSDANFLLLRPRWASAHQVWEELLKESILVRDCSTWPGLSGCLRVTVGTVQENERFIAALSASARR